MPKQRKSPPEKKALSYQKDHVLQVEYPNAFRSYWPRRKAQANRYVRHLTQQRLNTLIPNTATDQRDTFPPISVRRPRVRKWMHSVVPLKERVSNRHQRRIERAAWNFFKKPYQAATHRDRFCAFLSQLVQEQSEIAHHVARMFAELLDDRETVLEKVSSSMGDSRREWLEAFLGDEPSWKIRLQQWIKHISASQE